MGVTYLQANLTAGELAPTLDARVDITKYANGLANAENMVILPHGGMRRRPGLSKINLIDDTARLLPFVFSTTQKYLIVLKPLSIDIYRDDVLVDTEVTTYDATEIFEVDVIQSADTMIFAHGSYPPKELQRQGSDTSWVFQDIAFDNLPYYNFGTVIIEKYVNTGTAQTVNISVDEVVLNRDGNNVNGNNYTYYKALVAQSSIDLSLQDFSNTTNWTLIGTQEASWSATRGYPQAVTFHGGRLWFAATTQRPTSIWGSKISGFFDFDLGESASDDAIADILDSDEFNIIQNIFSGRSLQVFTSGGEFVNKAKPITPAESDWARQTGYGSTKIRPIIIDGATLFVDSSGRTIRQFLFDFNEDSYVSLNASLLSSHLITKAKAISAIKGTKYDVGDYVYVINEDGTVAVLNTMRHEEIAGWTHWTTQGEFKDVTVLDKDVYFLIYRNGSNFIEKLTENTYTDHNVILNGVKPETYNITYLGDNVVLGSDNIVYADISTGIEVTEIQTDYNGLFVNTFFKVIADFSIMPNAQYEGVSDNNKITISRGAYRVETGLNFLTNIRTLPISTTTQKGVTLHRRKRVVKADINVLNTLGVYAREYFKGDKEFTVVLDKAPKPFTGFREMYLLGYSRLTEIEITQKEPLPFILRGIGYEVAY